MNYPLITVIIPTYNYAHLITNAIQSVFTQNYPADKIEIVIVDDGSTDDTEKVVTALQDNRIRFHYQKNAGKAAATAKAIELSNGKYIFNLDADDYFLKGKIPKTVEKFEQFPHLVHVSSPAKIIWEGEGREKIEPIPEQLLDKVLKGEELNTFFMENNMLYGGGSTYAVRASVIKSIFIPADVNLYIDEYLIVAVLPYGDSYIFSEALSVWRVHGKNYSGKRRTKEEIMRRDQQLLASSNGMLNQLRQLDNFPSAISNLYEFKHKMREISAKEKAGSKSLGDIVDFFLYFCLRNRQSLKVLKKYSAFNRLLPISFIRLLKR